MQLTVTADDNIQILHENTFHILTRNTGCCKII